MKVFTSTLLALFIAGSLSEKYLDENSFLADTPYDDDVDIINLDTTTRVPDDFRRNEKIRRERKPGKHKGRKEPRKLERKLLFVEDVDEETGSVDKEGRKGRKRKGLQNLLLNRKRGRGWRIFKGKDKGRDRVKGPAKRQRRYVNSQEYLSSSDAPSYLVRINRKDVSSGTKKTICAGSIISSNLVLTSGGCLHEDWSTFQKEKRLIPIWQLEVVAGDYNSSVTESSEQIRTPIQMYIHPKLRMVDHRKMWENDIAIIQVDTDFVFNSNVSKVDLWLSHFAVNESDYEYYTMLRSSGYGDWGSHSSKQYDNLFDTFYPFPRDIPQYQYLAYVDGGDCVTQFSGVNDVEYHMVTLRPNAVNPHTPKPLLTAKRCFYTSKTRIAGYIPTTGDYGGPITWTSKDNNVEYQVMLTPWSPESKSSFETDMNYQHWGELLSYYTDFIGNVFDRAGTTSKTDHYPEFTSKSTWTQFTQTISLQYFGQYQYYTRFKVEAGKHVQVNITLSGENAAYTMRNSVVNVRCNDTKRVLKQFIGLNRTVTESVEVTAASAGSTGAKWGCTLKTGVQYSDPPTLASTTAAFATEGSTEESVTSGPPTDDTYTCEDAPVNSAGGTPNTPSSFVLKSNWDTVFYNSTSGKQFEIEFLINRPPQSADSGGVTLTVDYIYLDTNEFVQVDEQCDAGHLMCDDKLSCISPDHVCDRDPDCFDKNDESFWCLHKPCLSSQYQCTTGECLELRTLCDGTCDCLDHVVCEDETLLCSDNPFKPNNLLRFLLDTAGLNNAAGNKVDQIQRKSLAVSSADHFEISLSFVLVFLYGLCYIFD